MSTQLYDAGAVLIPSGTITTTTTFPSLQMAAHAFGETAWTIHIASITATTTLTVILETSTSEAGSYAEISRFTWPTGETTAQQIALGASASVARSASNSSRVSWIRARALVGGSTPSVTLQAWLGKFGGGVGTGSKPGQALAFP